MLMLKPSVDIRGLRPEMVVALLVLHDAFRTVAPDVPLVITSALDGDHRVTSYHYSGLALDIRTKTLTRPQLALIASLVRGSLTTTPKTFDVIIEDQEGPNEHMHIEFDHHVEGPLESSERKNYAD